MLETVREYAWERLEESGEADAVRNRHAAHYAGALEGWDADLKGPRQLEALAEIEADLDNARVTWQWAVERAQVEWLGRAIQGLCQFYEWRGRYEESLAACQRVIDSLEGHTSSLSSAESLTPTGGLIRLRVLAQALTWQGDVNRTLGQYTLADDCLERAWALWEDPRTGDPGAHGAFTLWCMGLRATYIDLDRAGQLAERSLALYQAAGDRWGIALARLLLGAVALWAGNYGQAKPQLEACLDLCRKLGDRRNVAFALLQLSQLEADMGQLEGAERLVREAIALARELGVFELLSTTLVHLSVVLNYRGRFAEASEAREEELAICRDRGMLDEATRAMIYLGSLATRQGLYDKARAWLHPALSTRLQSGARRSSGTCYLELGRLALAEGAYNQAEDWLQQGLAIFERLGRRPMLAGLLSTFALLARKQGHVAQARQHLRGAVQILVESRSRNAALQSLLAMALLLLDEGAPERAVELYALASRYPNVANSRWVEDVAGREIRAAAEGLPPEVVASAQERGRVRDLWATVEELLDELGGSSSD
jgi:tetratricopeptide (TPR) repeat protein